MAALIRKCAQPYPCTTCMALSDAKSHNFAFRLCSFCRNGVAFATVCLTCDLQKLRASLAHTCFCTSKACKSCVSMASVAAVLQSCRTCGGCNWAGNHWRCGKLAKLKTSGLSTSGASEANRPPA